MQLKGLRVALVLLALTSVSGGVVGAEGVFSTTDDNGRVDVVASTAPVVNVGSGGARCTWRWMTVGEVTQLAPPQGPPLSDGELAKPAVSTVDGVEFRVYLVVCQGSTTIRLVDPTITPGDLIPAVRDHAEGLIQLPEPMVSPPLDAPGVVNLGMWLAAAQVGYESITAEAGPVWITVSPQIASTTFSFGNGDEVTCEGFGVPIVDVDTIEQGPCGYTYRERGDFVVTVTSTWSLPYTSSSGSGAIEPMQRSITVPYQVVEIQTIGTRG